MIKYSLLPKHLQTLYTLNSWILCIIYH